MFSHLLYYRLKQLLKSKSIFFWSLFFPIILACFFKMAFSNLDSDFNFTTISVAIVQTADTEENTRFSEIVTVAKNNENKIFNVHSFEKKEAQQALKENKISGFYLLTESEPSLIINRNGFNQTILKNFLQQFNYGNNSIKDVLKENPKQLSDETLKQLNTTKTYTKKINYGENEPKSTSIYFFAVIAMACMFGMNWGIKNSDEIQANQSPEGIRINMCPVNKFSLIIINLLAAFMIFFTEMMIILGFIHFVLQIDFGNRWSMIVLTCLVACLLSISLGSFVGCAIKGNYQLKSTIVTVVSVFGAFLSGMMFPDIKYWIENHLPILAWINPTNLITDALYKLFYYTDLSSFYLTITAMGIMTLIFTIANYFIMRRQTYASI